MGWWTCMSTHLLRAWNPSFPKAASRRSVGRSAWQMSHRNVATSSPSFAVTDMWLGVHPHSSNGTPQRMQYLIATPSFTALPEDSHT